MPFLIDWHTFPKSSFYKKRDIKINFIQNRYSTFAFKFCKWQIRLMK